jgi:Leucine-rich repeat (LRR) protein
MERSSSPRTSSLISPPTDLSIEKLPYEQALEIALNLNYRSIINLCKSSKQLKSICEDPYFWRTKFNLDTKEEKRINVPKDIRDDVNPARTLYWYKYKVKQYGPSKNLLQLVRNGKVNKISPFEFKGEWDIFDIIDNITLLDVENVGIEELPDMVNVRDLNCARNRLTLLPNIPNIEILNCFYNELTFLSSNMRKLEILICSHNRIISLPNMPNLEYLNCQRNKLTFLPPGMLKLEQLYCSYNKLTDLPYLPNLKKLECRNNPLPVITLQAWKKRWAARKEEIETYRVPEEDIETEEETEEFTP